MSACWRPRKGAAMPSARPPFRPLSLVATPGPLHSAWRGSVHPLQAGHPWPPPSGGPGRVHRAGRGAHPGQGRGPRGRKQGHVKLPGRRAVFHDLSCVRDVFEMSREVIFGTRRRSHGHMLERITPNRPDEPPRSTREHSASVPAGHGLPMTEGLKFVGPAIAARVLLAVGLAPAPASVDGGCLRAGHVLSPTLQGPLKSQIGCQDDLKGPASLCDTACVPGRPNWLPTRAACGQQGARWPSDARSPGRRLGRSGHVRHAARSSTSCGTGPAS
jgi:hypothetical protein